MRKPKLCSNKLMKRKLREIQNLMTNKQNKKQTFRSTLENDKNIKYLNLLFFTFPIIYEEKLCRKIKKKFPPKIY